MAQSDHSDLFISFVDMDGNSIGGEDGTDFWQGVDAYDQWLDGFDARCCFEVDSFRFSVGLEDDGQQNSSDIGKVADKLKVSGDPATAKIAQALKGAARGSKFDGFRRGLRGEGNGYPVDLKPISFSRQMDSASIRLFDACSKISAFGSATLIKRKAAGSVAAGEVYLRMDFKNVLITSIDWSDDHSVKEDYKFVCRSVTINYRPQKFDGTFSAGVRGFWSLVDPPSKAFTIGSGWG